VPNTLRHNDSNLARWWTPVDCGLNVMNSRAVARQPKFVGAVQRSVIQQGVEQAR